jgi:hypothetical protein
MDEYIEESEHQKTENELNTCHTLASFDFSSTKLVYTLSLNFSIVGECLVNGFDKFVQNDIKSEM